MEQFPFVASATAVRLFPLRHKNGEQVVLVFQSELPDLDNDTSDRLRTFIQYRQDQRSFPASFYVIR